MPFQIQPCSPLDAPGLARTMISARLTDPHWAKLWEDPSPEPIISRTAKRIPWTLVQSGESKRLEKVIDETGQIVGYARWILPTHLAKSDIWPHAQVVDVSPDQHAEYEAMYKENSLGAQPIGLRTDGIMAFRGAALDKVDARIMKDGPFLVLDYLVTDPGFWRRGVGGMLVRSGLEIADRHQVKTYVMSSSAGLKVYLNSGFELVESVRTDYSQYGGTEPVEDYFLVRKPTPV